MGDYKYESEIDRDMKSGKLKRLPGEGDYPEFEHVAGAPGLAIGERYYIDSGPEPKRNSATDNLFED